jgi:phosphonate transport system substrate-binding protein
MVRKEIKMSHKLFKFLTLLVFLLGTAGCIAAPAPAPTVTPVPEPTIAPRSIVLGAVSDDPAKKIKAFQPLADYLGAHLGQLGITSGEVKIAPDQDTMIKWLKDGTVDLFFDSPYTAMIMNDQAGAQIILRSWKSGLAEYNSLILVRKDSGIKSLADLNGHVVAFDDPTSTTAYMLPLAYMIEGGLKVVEVTSADSSVPADEAGYLFATGQDNVTAWLVTGKVSAGTFGSHDLKDVPADVMDQFAVLVETEAVPRFLVLVRPGMDQAEVDAIKALLVGLDQTPEGPDILKTFEKTAKFDELPNAEAMLARMRQLYEVVKSH